MPSLLDKMQMKLHGLSMIDRGGKKFIIYKDLALPSNVLEDLSIPEIIDTFKKMENVIKRSEATSSLPPDERRSILLSEGMEQAFLGFIERLGENQQGTDNIQSFLVDNQKHSSQVTSISPQAELIILNEETGELGLYSFNIPEADYTEKDLIMIFTDLIPDTMTDSSGNHLRVLEKMILFNKSLYTCDFIASPNIDNLCKALHGIVIASLPFESMKGKINNIFYGIFSRDINFACIYNANSHRYQLSSYTREVMERILKAVSDINDDEMLLINMDDDDKLIFTRTDIKKTSSNTNGIFLPPDPRYSFSISYCNDIVHLSSFMNGEFRYLKYFRDELEELLHIFKAKGCKEVYVDKIDVEVEIVLNADGAYQIRVPSYTLPLNIYLDKLDKHIIDGDI